MSTFLTLCYAEENDYLREQLCKPLNLLRSSSNLPVEMIEIMSALNEWSSAEKSAKGRPLSCPTTKCRVEAIRSAKQKAVNEGLGEIVKVCKF